MNKDNDQADASEILEEATLEGPRVSETAEQFSRRLEMLERLSPALASLATSGWQVSVERESGQGARMEMDFVIQLSDLRLALLLRPGVAEATPDSDTLLRIHGYLLSAPEIDAVVVVGDDDQISAAIVDIYATLAGDPLSEDTAPFEDRVKEYAFRNLSSVELPRFADAVRLPTLDELADRLTALLAKEFHQTTQQNVRIPQRIAALESLDVRDHDLLRRIVSSSLRKSVVDIGPLLGEEATDA